MFGEYDERFELRRNVEDESGVKPERLDGSLVTTVHEHRASLWVKPVIFGNNFMWLLSV